MMERGVMVMCGDEIDDEEAIAAWEACGPGWGKNDYDDYEGGPVRCEDDYDDCEPEWWQEEAERQRECLEQEYAETRDPARRRMLKIM